MTELEDKLLNNRKAQMVAYLNTHPAGFDEAVSLAISDNQPYAWRAALTLKNSISKNDTRLTKYISKLILALPNKKDGHQRELLKIVKQFDINKDDEGLLFNHCVTIWEAIDKQSSVRGTAHLIMCKIAKKYPELKNELKHLGEDYYLTKLSPGIKKGVLKQINRL